MDWWVNTRRVGRRLSSKARLRLDPAHFFAAGVEIINPAQIDGQGWPIPSASINFPAERGHGEFESVITLVEIPADFLAMKAVNIDLAKEWRLHTRSIFEHLFEDGYFVTDFVHLPGINPRSYYVLSHGDGTL